MSSDGLPHPDAVTAEAQSEFDRSLPILQLRHSQRRASVSTVPQTSEHSQPELEYYFPSWSPEIDAICRSDWSRVQFPAEKPVAKRTQVAPPSMRYPGLKPPTFADKALAVPPLREVAVEYGELDLSDGLEHVQCSIPASLVLRHTSANDIGDVLSLVASACLVPQLLHWSEYDQGIARYFKGRPPDRDSPERRAQRHGSHSSLISRALASMTGSSIDDDHIAALVSNMRSDGTNFLVDHCDEGYLAQTRVTIRGPDDGLHQADISWVLDDGKVAQWPNLVGSRDRPADKIYRLAP